MRVFVIGGTGYIGTAVVRRLVGAGHTVTGLVRSAERQQQLQALGGRGVLGDIKTPSSYVAAAAEHDAAVHLGFESGEHAGGTDRIAVDTLLEAARSSGRPFGLLYTSGVLVLGPAGSAPSDETSSTANALLNTWRPVHERLVLSANSLLVAATVLRPGWVYGGKDGLAAGYFQSATREGRAAFIGDGQNRMPLVQREALAELYRLAVEQRTSGVLHAVEDVTGRILDYATAASRAAGKGGAVRSIPLSEAKRTLGAFADAYCLDQWVVSSRSQALGWKPGGPFLQRADDAFSDWQRASASG
jgi:nucleoside-diphosphate-sugar epimerase